MKEDPKHAEAKHPHHAKKVDDTADETPKQNAPITPNRPIVRDATTPADAVLPGEYARNLPVAGKGFDAKSSGAVQHSVKELKAKFEEAGPVTPEVQRALDVLANATGGNAVILETAIHGVSPKEAEENAGGNQKIAAALVK